MLLNMIYNFSGLYKHDRIGIALWRNAPDLAELQAAAEDVAAAGERPPPGVGERPPHGGGEVPLLAAHLAQVVQHRAQPPRRPPQLGRRRGASPHPQPQQLRRHRLLLLLRKLLLWVHMLLLQVKIVGES